MTTAPAIPFPAMPEQPQRTMQLTKLSTVKPEPIRWLVPGRIPYGALTILAGRPGEGKSQLSLTLAADLSHRAAVILVGAEDGLADTVAPRLIASRGNLDNVYAVETRTERGFEDAPILPTDVPLLEDKVRESGAALLIVDPFAAHLDPELNALADQSVRQATRPLARMARETGCAVVIIAHLRKSRDGSPLDWIGGSGLTGAARSVLMLGRHKQEEPFDEDKRYLCHVKVNGARLAPTLRCHMQQINVETPDRLIESSRVVMDPEDVDKGTTPWDLQ